MPYGMGPWGWLLDPYVHRRCRRFPWLPRWWWAGIYRAILPHPAPYWIPPLPKEEEIAILEEVARMLEQELERIKKRLEELKK